MKELIEQTNKKKEFSQLPDSVVKRALEKSNRDIKEARRILRKYFGVFLTNKILKGKDVLEKHISTRNRNYKSLYEKILDNEKSAVDLGAGVNGFSYPYFNKNIKYTAIEATGQLVALMNNYFKKNKFNAIAIQHDLFDIDFILGILKKQNRPRVVFMLNIIDALEIVKDFSKKFLPAISKECEKIVLSFSTESLSGKKKFAAKRLWLINFINENFDIIESFEISGEKFFIFKNKKNKKK